MENKVKRRRRHPDVDADGMYKSYKKLIYKECHKAFFRYHGKIEFEELVSEANVMFSRVLIHYHEYDKRKSKFSTFICCSIRYQLSNYIRTQLRIKRRYEKADFKEAIDMPYHEPNPEHQVILFERFNRLSDSAKDIINFILYEADSDFRITKNNITRHFRSTGKRFKEIWDGWDEIKNFFNPI